MITSVRSRTTNRAPSAGMLVALAGVFGGALVFVYALFVHTEIGQRVDNAALLGRAAVPEGLIEDAWTMLDTISILSLVLAGMMVAVIGIARRRPVLAAAAGAVLLGSNVTTQVLKRAILTRPELLDDGVKAYNTLPSGHATVALSVVAALVLVAPRHRRSMVALVGTGYSAMIGVATVVAGWHRPSDAVTAWLVVGMWTSMAAAVLAMRRDAVRVLGDAPGADATEALMWVGAAALLMATLAGGLALAFVTASAEVAEFGGFGPRSLAFLSAVAGITGSALFAMASLVGGIRPVSSGGQPG
ncbi:phosphatase PAP2 family protein [bacterium]|nr:phosphatase PAP2 family protein [bacterium]